MPTKSVLLSVVLAGLFAALSLPAEAQATKTSGTLQVKLNYTGEGKVDESHKIFVVLWDSPAFIGGQAEPMELKPVTSKNGAATFENISKSPVYVSVAFDREGHWDGQTGPPPTGTSLGMYMKEPGKPEPIEIANGKTATIEVSFDDSIKMK